MPAGHLSSSRVTPGFPERRVLHASVFLRAFRLVLSCVAEIWKQHQGWRWIVEKAGGRGWAWGDATVRAPAIGGVVISKTQEHFEHHSAASSGQEWIRWIARGRMSVNDEFHLARIGQVGEDCFLLIMLCGGEPSNGSHVCIDAQVACWFERK